MIKKIKPLGVLKYKNKIVNHRSIIKIIFNPLLRLFGYEIASLFKNNIFIKYIIKKCDIQTNIYKNYYYTLFTCNRFDLVLKKNYL